MGQTIGIVLGIVFIMVVFIGLKRKNRHSRGSNVIHLNPKAKISRAGNAQPCSKCRRKRQLTFCADDSGAVRGLCNECRRELEQHQELYPV